MCRRQHQMRFEELAVPDLCRSGTRRIDVFLVTGQISVFSEKTVLCQFIQLDIILVVAALRWYVVIP